MVTGSINSNCLEELPGREWTISTTTQSVLYRFPCCAYIISCYALSIHKHNNDCILPGNDKVNLTPRIAYLGLSEPGTMKQLNIAMVAACPFPENRGTPSRILRMAESLARRGHKVHVVTYNFGKDIETQGIQIHRIRDMKFKPSFSPGPTILKLSLLDPLLFFKLLRIIDEENIDLIHAHHFEGALVSYAVRSIKKVPVIYDAHTTLTGELPSYGLWNIKGIAHFLDRFVPGKADFTVAVSNRLRESILGQGVPDDKISVIPTGVNLGDFVDANPANIRRKHELGSANVIIYTGTLEEYQNIELLLGAMQHVVEKFGDVILLLVGREKTGKFAELSDKLGIQDNVHFVGEEPFSAIPDYLACADVAVTSRVNCPGVPQKLTNYMMAGKAIVGFRGSASLLSHGINGLVVENGDVEAMAEAIVKLLKDPSLRRTLGQNAQETARERFDWDVLSKKLEDDYIDLLDQ